MPRRQCEKCPWKVITNPREIPNGYTEARHRSLSSTIAKPADPAALDAEELRIMSCHETHEVPCVGWLNHQLGIGTNIVLRLEVRAGRIKADVETVGEQHLCLEDTFPDVF